MITALLALAAHAAATCPTDAAALRRYDQALMDSFVPGDHTLWEKLLTPDAVYLDENGAIMPRAAFLKQLKPLPAPNTGQIAIIDYKVRFSGDTALVLHRVDEHETYHGVALRAHYLTTETWLCRDGGWKLSLIHAYVEAKDPPAIQLPPAQLDDYVGRYAVAPDLVWVIARSGDHLTGGRAGSPPKPLLVEVRDVLFTPGEPRDKRIFQRDAHGRVTGFIQRREGEDIPWKRLP
jgi:hypothetical protein